MWGVEEEDVEEVRLCLWTEGGWEECDWDWGLAEGRLAAELASVCGSERVGIRGVVSSSLSRG